MAKLSKPRAGSLQFWPRKRAAKLLPSVHWPALNKIKQKSTGFLGYITYKVGMASAIVKDNTEHSMTKGKKIIVPVTIFEAPSFKIYSIRFYSAGKVVKDIIVNNDKILKKIFRIPKEIKPFESQIPKIYDDIRAVVFSLPQQTAVKKTPDIIELGIYSQSKEEKLDFVKKHINKEISLQDVVPLDLVDVRGLTTGRGLSGPVKRFGIALKQHKTEKGRRRPGSLAPWHPARVTFRTPMAGQLGMFSRVHYNLKLITSGNTAEKNINPKGGFKHYGQITSNYIIIKGSVQGPPKRQILITPSFRPKKIQQKKKFEFLELLA